ncbi:MAG: hypothetical protein L0322_07550 [Chloroflexi bacterium]|nr:hypothetical protein [Chloroflexota bacterium]MCI0578067.1 hypothetical protein [Chloroflexota bacterium]MCI0646055.1 hypothetical protein [Chloroflexota bacterium]
MLILTSCLQQLQLFPGMKGQVSWCFGCVVVADHTKFGRVSAVFLAPVTAAHVIVTDRKLTPTTVAESREKGLEVYLA